MPNTNGQQPIAQQLALLHAKKQQITPPLNTSQSMPQVIQKQNKRKQGKKGRTRWDWLQLLTQIIGALAIPISIVGLIISIQQFNIQQQYDQNRVTDQEQQAVLETYLDRMSDLLFAQHLADSKHNDEVRSVARARTLAALQNLDPIRKGILLQFLYQSQLINKTINSKDNKNPIINLSGADLSGADLSGAGPLGADLSGADLSGTNLEVTNLFHTNLSGADLSGSIIAGANLTWSVLTKATLTKADLSDAKLSEANLTQANLSGANLAHANLSNANLAHANLSKTIIAEADLTQAILFGADLSGAYLIQTNLSGAYLIQANLRGTDFSQADLSGASISQADLSRAYSCLNTTMPNGQKHTQHNCSQ